MDSWSKNLELIIKSRTPLIWIRTKEEERLHKILNQSCERLNIKRFVSWDCINGLKGLLNDFMMSLKEVLAYFEAIYLEKANPELYTDSLPIPLLPNVFISFHESILSVKTWSLKIISLVESQ